MENLCEDIVALRLKHFTPWSLKARGGGGVGKGAYSWEFLVGICGPVLQILDPISDQKM